VTSDRYATARLDEFRRESGWSPVRRHFGIGAFGVNGWHAAEAGADVIQEHTEEGLGHEELYLVVEGHATFTLDGETVDAPAGTMVFVRDPTLRRRAVAREDATTVLAIGAKPGEAYAGSPWEENAEIFPLFGQGRYEEARERLEEALARYPEQASLLYNLACAETRLGEHEVALAHLRRSVELDARFLAYAADDPDLEAIRSEIAFPVA
jgi:tetratricopeptide (TPR) repeat protein